MVEGREPNIRYFYLVIKERIRRNSIVLIKTSEGGRIEEVKGVKEEVARVLESRFKEPIKAGPRLEGLDLRKMSEEESCNLEVEFSREEVKNAILDSEGEKSTWPDGLNFKFLQECWNFVEVDLVNFVIEIDVNTIVPKSIITSFIALIPKNILKY